METSVLLQRLFGAVALLVPAYFVLVPWLTRNWPTAKAEVVEVASTNPDGLYARYRKFKHGKDCGIEYEVRGQRYRKNPNIEAVFKADSFSAHAVSTIHEEFEVRYHPDNPNRYSIAHAYKPCAKWTVTVICVTIGAATIWTSF